MKIVINKCYGGFSLSALGLKRLTELQGKPCYFFTGGIGDKPLTPVKVDKVRGQFWNAYTVPNPEEVTISQNNWAKLSEKKRIESNKSWNDIYLSNRPDDRTDPLLIQVVEELADKANGDCAKLAIIEIPDGVSWELDEYDGIETVREIHRSWS